LDSLFCELHTGCVYIGARGRASRDLADDLRHNSIA
jgi:hypothetical protein